MSVDFSVRIIVKNESIKLNPARDFPMHDRLVTAAAAYIPLVVIAARRLISLVYAAVLDLSELCGRRLKKILFFFSFTHLHRAFAFRDSRNSIWNRILQGSGSLPPRTFFLFLSLSLSKSCCKDARYMYSQCA